jgi:hypothetical protein
MLHWRGRCAWKSERRMIVVRVAGARVRASSSSDILSFDIHP